MERIFQKIGRIRQYKSLIISMQDDCVMRFRTDPLYRGALLYYLYLLTDSCVALAELVIKYKNLRIPQSYHEAFDILGEHHILEAEFAFQFAKIAGFRNFLAHDYERIDPEFICTAVIPKLDDIDAYLQQIEATLAAPRDVC